MSALNFQKDLIANFKREVILNTSILTKIYPIDVDLSRQIFKEDALEKPTQHVFIHLSYYLVSIIDSQRSKLITWPLYDSRAEKNYRNELSRFVADYCQLGLLSPVMSSYFVNPGCFRVVKLLFQLSHLAVQRTLRGRLLKESQVALYEDITKKYKSKKEDFVPIIEKETAKVLNSFSKFMQKKRMIEETIISSFHKKILENEKKLAALNDKMLLDDLIANFIKTNKLTDINLKIMLEIKENKNTEAIFDQWQQQTDSIITEIDKNWDKNFTKVVKLAENCRNTSQTLISRQTGDADKKLYSIEYNHKAEEIQTTELESTVSIQQKYVLKNLVIKEKLQFPTLIRAYLISISYLLNGVDLTDDLEGFNMAMECEGKNYEQVISALKALIDRIEYAEGRLLPRQLPRFNSSINFKEFSDIPPLPDLSDLKTTRDLPFQSTFTPLTISKHQFNLRKRYANSKPIFVAPQPRLFVTPAHAPREDFLKTIQSCKIGSFDQTNRTQNMSFMSEAAKRINETIADCNTGFTKQQIQRLLSTKKKGSTTKKKFNLDRPKINVKKGGLFNDTADSMVMRSHSSPDLYGNKKNRRQNLLSVMQEDIPALLEVSGISIIRNDSEFNTPKEDLSEESSRTHFDVPIRPVYTISPVQYLDAPIIPVINSSCRSPVQNRDNNCGNVQYRDKNCGNVQYLDKNCDNVQYRDQNCGNVQYLDKNCGNVQYLDKNCDNVQYRDQNCDNVQYRDQNCGNVQYLDNNCGKVQYLDNNLSNNVLINLDDSIVQTTPPEMEIHTKKTHPSKIPILEHKHVMEEIKTPQTVRPLRKSTSIEKIINRFKKVKANVLNDTNDVSNCSIIQEEKENINAVNLNLFHKSTKKVILPDLLSPNYGNTDRNSDVKVDSNSFEELCLGFEEKGSKKPRQSLGTALGVDQTFLDQFELID